MDKLLTLSYYFTTRPDPNFHYSKLTLVVAAALIAVSLLVRLWRKKTNNEIKKRILKRYPGPLIAFALTLLVLLLFRVSGIPLFSMRILWILWGLIFVYWIVKSLLNYRKEYRNRYEQSRKNKIQSRYLPKRK